MSYQYKLDCSKGRNLRGMKQTVFKRWNGSFSLVCLFWTCLVSSPSCLILIDVSPGSAAEAMMFASREVILMLAHLIVSYIQCLQSTVLRVFLATAKKSFADLIIFYNDLYPKSHSIAKSCMLLFLIHTSHHRHPIQTCPMSPWPPSNKLAGWALTAHRAQGASMDEGAVALLRGLFSPGQADAARWIMHPAY